MRRVFPVLAIALGCSSESASSEATITDAGGSDCHLTACVNHATLSFRIAVPDDRLLGSTLELCHNGRCSRATVAAFGAMATLMGELRGRLSVERQSASHIAISVLLAGAGDYPYGLTDGEYALQLTDASGVKLAGFSTNLRYSETYANGKGCEPFLPCRSASHDAGDFVVTAPVDAGVD